jgi:hypothetical protein
MEWKGGHSVNNAALVMGMSTSTMLMRSWGVFNIATVGNSVIPTVEPRPALSGTVTLVFNNKGTVPQIVQPIVFFSNCNGPVYCNVANRIKNFFTE